MVDYPKDWKREKLGNCIDKYINGTSLEEFFQKNGSKRVVSLGNYSEDGKYIDDGNRIVLNSKTSKFLVDKDDLCMVLNDKGNGRLVGKTILINQDNKYIINQRSLRLIINKDTVLPIFLQQLINSEEFRFKLIKYIQGNTQVYINPPAIMDIDIDIPESQYEQKAISNVLLSFDKHIENLTKLIEKKKMIRDGALEDLMSGRNRLESFENGWKQVPLNQFAQINPKGNIPREFYYVDLESVKGKSLIGKEKYSKDVAPSRAQRAARYGDIFFQTVRPYQKNNYLYKSKNDEFVFSSGYAQLRTDNSSDFLFQLIFNDSFVNRVLDNCTGTSYPAINPKALGNILIYVPVDIKEQEAIADILSSMDKEIENLKKEKEKYVELKAGAMDDLLTGRVRLV